MILAYSYVRFSSPDQASGDSLRRQTDGRAEAFCKRHSLTLDTALSLSDLGVSAFKGKHRSDKHDLGKFLEQARQGRIPAGSYFLVENLDRLTREEIKAALSLFIQIQECKIHIVQLDLETIYKHDSTDPFDLMRAIMELTRGHGESARKSDLLGQAWGAKKANARENGSVETTRVPAWLKVVGRRKEKDHMVGGQFKRVEDRVAIVRRIFDLAIKGCGIALIVKQLTGEKVPTWGRSGVWSKAYIRKILTGRAVLGEYQPRRGAKAEGEVVANYYPAIVGVETWQAVQDAMKGRKDPRGRTGEKVSNMFTGLLTDAAGGGKMLIAWQTQGSGAKKRKTRVLVPASAMEGRQPTLSFPYEVFEKAVLWHLREVTAADVFGPEPEGVSVGLARELAGVEGRLRAITNELTGDGSEGEDGTEDIPALAKAARVLEEKRLDLVKRLATARHAERHPRSATLAEAKTLLGVMGDPTARMMLRGLLPQMLSDIYVLVVPRGSFKLAALQLFFREGARRDYLVLYKPGRRGVATGWASYSLTGAELDSVGLRMFGGDLREPGEPQEAAEWLAVVPLELVFPIPL